MLAAICVSGGMRLAMAEIAYRDGFQAADLQVKLDRLTDAALWWPFDPKFRTGQALTLFELARSMPGAVEAAEASLSGVMVTDGNTMSVVSSLLGARLALHQCDAVDGLRDHLLRIAGSRPSAKVLARMPCQ